MEYPLNLSFKLLALAPQLSITDSSGRDLFYVKQKMFKLKEEITVFTDKTQSEALYKINADRIIDFSAQYNFTDVGGTELGAVKRSGMKSIWKTHYNIFAPGEEQTMQINEENPWIKFLDGIVGQIAIIGMFAGYFFNPSYLVTRNDGTPVMRIKKMPAFFEGKFQITLLTEEIDEEEEKYVMLSIIMMTLLERMKG